MKKDNLRIKNNSIRIWKKPNTKLFKLLISASNSFCFTNLNILNIKDKKENYKLKEMVQIIFIKLEKLFIG